MDIIITLILVGLLLMFVEVVLVPGVGISGILGVAAMIASVWLAWVDYGMSAGLIVASVNILLVILLILIAVKTSLWKRLALKTNIESKVESFKEGEILAGEKGKAQTRLAPMGTVRFGEKSLECKSLEGIIDPGTDVEVARIEDNHVCVRKSIVANN